ncbi:MAG TPA: hypothetical protein PLZ21_02705, partial [Armatimonadota bacterium]|nr:hypothetical protein [Armatimonadota bacterium]
MDQEKLIHSLKLQLRIERTAILLLTLILLGRWAYGNFHTRYFAIYVNNKPVACLATREAADQVITQVKSAVAGAKASQVSFKENVKIKRAPRDAKTQSEKEAIKSVLGKVSLRVVKWAILLDGIPVVAVDSEEQAGDVLESAKERFGSMVENLMEEPHFKEQVTAEEMPVDLA